MRKFICISMFVFGAISAFAQPNLTCYRDTSMVDEIIFRVKDTSWVVKPVLQQGDWNIYYDFNLTKIKSEVHYTDKGVKTGIWKEYYKNGALRSEFDYNSPVVSFCPPGKELYQNGKTKMTRTQVADTVLETHYYITGKVSKINTWYKDGRLVRQREWCENGTLIVDYNPTNAEPVAVKKYFCDGQVKAEFNWYAYGYTGAYKEYYQNGKVAVDGMFTEKPKDVTAYVARKTGVWSYYDEKGKVTKKETWENGKLIKTEK